MKTLSKVMDWIEKICTEICVILLVVITAVIFYQVVARKLGYSVLWVDETTRYSFVLMVFAGTISVARHATHIRITSFVDLLPRKIRKVTESVTYLLVAGMSGLFSYCCFYTAKSTGDVRFSMLTFIKMSQLYNVIGIVAILIVVMTVFHILEIWTGGVTLPDGPNKEE